MRLIKFEQSVNGTNCCVRSKNWKIFNTKLHSLVFVLPMAFLTAFDFSLTSKNLFLNSAYFELLVPLQSRIQRNVSTINYQVRDESLTFESVMFEVYC